MLTAFQKHISNNFPVLFKSKVGVAISGGVDSVVLTYLCKLLQIDICLLHCNFQLRGAASDGDQLFVKKLATQLQVPFATINFDTQAYINEHKVSTQIAARELRYNWFEKMAKIHNLDTVLTAHHLDDNLETFIINLSRGSGLLGLTGIPKKNNLCIRPLLPFSKKELIAFAEVNKWDWREDSSNSETKYLRNKIRHQIVPELKGLTPNFQNNFLNTITYLEQSQEVVSAYVKQVKDKILIKDASINGFKLSVSELKKEKHADLVLFEVLKEFKFTAWKDISSLIDAQSGKKIHSENYTLLKDRDYLLLYPSGNKEKACFAVNKSDSQLVLSATQQLVFETKPLQIKLKSSRVVLDIEKLKFPLVVRRWKQGDYFYPVGMQGKKKLSKYFKDEKFSALEKENTWLLCSEGKVVWVINKRADRRFSTNESAEVGLVVEYQEN